MANYRGENVAVTFAGTDISGDGRSVSISESAEALDNTVYGDANKTKQAGLKDGSGSFSGLDTTGAWSTGWNAIAVGSENELVIYPEGNTTGNRSIAADVVVTERALELPYDGLVTFSMSFEVSGAVTEAVVA